MDPTTLFFGVLAFMWASFLWDEYLDYRQYRKYVDVVDRPEEFSEIMDEENFKKSRLYKIDKSRFSFVHSFYSQLETTLVLIFGILPLIWGMSEGILTYFRLPSGEIPRSIVFFTVFTVVETIIGLPWSVYDTFVIEERHGFNKQTALFYAKDKVKKFILTMVLSVPILSALIWIIQWGGRYFFIYVWIFMSALIFFLMTVYPDFIAPLFDKYTPLPEGELRTNIEALASRVSYPLAKLYVVEGSKRSAHSNAYLYGFWNNKRIVLFDTLLNEYTPVDRGTTDENTNADENKPENAIEEEKSTDDAAPLSGKVTETTKPKKKLGMSNDEVVAVLGHELGHWALNHTVFNLVVAELNLLLMFAAFGYFYNQQIVYTAFGFVDSQPTIIGLLIVFQYIFAPYNEILGFLMKWVSRCLEQQADDYSANLGYAPLLSSALIKLAKDNLSFPVDDWLYSVWNYSHPPVPERVERLKKYK